MILAIIALIYINFTFKHEYIVLFIPILIFMLNISKSNSNDFKSKIKEILKFFILPLIICALLIQGIYVLIGSKMASITEMAVGIEISNGLAVTILSISTILMIFLNKDWICNKIKINFNLKTLLIIVSIMILVVFIGLIVSRVVLKVQIGKFLDEISFLDEIKNNKKEMKKFIEKNEKIIQLVDESGDISMSPMRPMRNVTILFYTKTKILYVSLLKLYANAMNESQREIKGAVETIEYELPKYETFIISAERGVNAQIVCDIYCCLIYFASMYAIYKLYYLYSKKKEENELDEKINN